MNKQEKFWVHKTILFLISNAALFHSVGKERSMYESLFLAEQYRDLLKCE